MRGANGSACQSQSVSQSMHLFAIRSISNPYLSSSVVIVIHVAGSYSMQMQQGQPCAFTSYSHTTLSASCQAHTYQSVGVVGHPVSAIAVRERHLESLRKANERHKKRQCGGRGLHPAVLNAVFQSQVEKGMMEEEEDEQERDRLKGQTASLSPPLSPSPLSIPFSPFLSLSLTRSHLTCSRPTLSKASRCCEQSSSWLRCKLMQRHEQTNAF